VETQDQQLGEPDRGEEDDRARRSTQQLPESVKGAHRDERQHKEHDLDDERHVSPRLRALLFRRWPGDRSKILHE
jgi:hypothetical protein